MLRVRGVPEPVDEREYATQLVSALRERLLIRDDAGAVVVPPVEELAERVVDLCLSSTPPEVNPLVAVLAPFWSAARATEALGLRSRSELHARRRVGQVLGCKTSNGHWIFPAGQFRHRDGTVEVRPGQVRFISRLREHDGWTVALLLQTPADELEGLTPMVSLREDRDQERLAEYARRLAAELEDTSAGELPVPRQSASSTQAGLDIELVR